MRKVDIWMIEIFVKGVDNKSIIVANLMGGQDGHSVYRIHSSLEPLLGELIIPHFY